MKDKFDLKLYVVKFQDGSYLIFNGLAETEEDVFKSTNKITEATFLNKSLKEELEEVFEKYNYYLYIQEGLRREFKKIETFETYLLTKEKDNK